MSRLGESARWFVFATTADDRRRSSYQRAIARARRADLARRRAVAATLPRPALPIDPAIGHASCDSSAFGGTAEVVAAAHTWATGSDAADQHAGSGKPYLFDQAASDLPRTSALLRFALHPELLASASQYLGTVPRLTGIYLLRSTFVGTPPDGSRLYHCDWEAVRQVKVFVNCTDISPENGPLTAITAEASSRVKATLGYHYGGPEFRLPDSRVQPLVGQDDVTAFTGPVGAVTLIDTSSCLHLGSRLAPDAAERVVLQLQYMPPDAFDLLRWRRKAGPAAPQALSSDLERLVLA